VKDLLMSFSLTSPLLLPYWEALEIASLFIVWVGVFGEYKAERMKSPYNPTSFPELESKKKRRESLWGAVLISGLAMEALASIFVLVISNKEIAGLKNQTEVLRQQNDELEAKTRARRITLEQQETFIILTRDVPKIPIKVCVGMADNETEIYAEQIRDMLDAAGFGFTNKSDGIIRDARVYLKEKIESSDYYSNFWKGLANQTLSPPYHDPDSDVIIIGNSTNYSDGKMGMPKGIELPFDIGSWGWQQAKTFTNQDGTYLIFEIANVSELPAVFDMGLNQIQIRCYEANSKFFLNPGEWGIFVQEKIHR
jgi:hypothetical protein